MKKGIPYEEFYRVVEFGKGLDKESCDRLEEALLEMGILDALVVEEQYRDKVMEANPGCADRYLFVRHGHVKESLLDVLDLNDSVNDISLTSGSPGSLEISAGHRRRVRTDLPAQRFTGMALIRSGRSAERCPVNTKQALSVSRQGKRTGRRRYLPAGTHWRKIKDSRKSSMEKSGIWKAVLPDSGRNMKLCRRIRICGKPGECSRISDGQWSGCGKNARSWSRS